MTWFILTLLVAALLALVVAMILGAILRRVGRRWPVAVEATRRGRLPFRLLFVLIALRQVIASTTLLGGWQETLITILQLAILAVCGWLLAILAFVLEDLTLARFRIDVADNRRARRIRTQASLLRRLAVALIIALVIASMLLTLPGAREAGATILASAGVIGIVAGLAAQSSLSNLFAGLQLAFTDAIRVDDVVVVETEWGRIEEITLTYVVVHIWDDRRLIMPSTYFTTTPFQNWTRKESAVLGAVEMDVDWRVPLTELRTELDRVLRESEIWDSRVGILQVTDAVGALVRVRVLVSGVDGPTVFDLRCEVREALVGYLQRHHPEALPRVRVEGQLPDLHGNVDGAAVDRRATSVGAPSARVDPGQLEFAGLDTSELDAGGQPVGVDGGSPGAGLPAERESEATKTQGLFTGSIAAIRRAREFRGTSEKEAGNEDPVRPVSDAGRTEKR